MNIYKRILDLLDCIVDISPTLKGTAKLTYDYTKSMNNDRLKYNLVQQALSEFILQHFKYGDEEDYADKHMKLCEFVLGTINENDMFRETLFRYDIHDKIYHITSPKLLNNEYIEGKIDKHKLITIDIKKQLIHVKTHVDISTYYNINKFDADFSDRLNSKLILKQRKNNLIKNLEKEIEKYTNLLNEIKEN